MSTKVRAARGEPWRTRFEPGALATKLRDMGFREVEPLSPELAPRTYFQDRRDDLPLLPSAHLMQATV